MERKLTCIICPLGCELIVKSEDKKILDISGHTCPRGKAYAEYECIAPKRTLTTTVRCVGGGLVPVKTATPIPKEKMSQAMQILNTVVIKLPVSIGDVVVEDLFGSKVVSKPMNTYNLYNHSIIYRTKKIMQGVKLCTNSSNSFFRT